MNKSKSPNRRKIFEDTNNSRISNNSMISNVNKNNIVNN